MLQSIKELSARMEEVVHNQQAEETTQLSEQMIKQSIQSEIVDWQK
jgi:hypothetical protein